MFQHLLWLRDLLADEEVTLPDEIGDAIARIAPTLRTLRLGDGTLARFHGGGLAEEARLTPHWPTAASAVVPAMPPRWASSG